MSKKLAAKASLIHLPPLPSPAGAVGPAAGNGSSGTAHSPHTASKRPLAGADAPAAAAVPGAVAGAGRVAGADVRTKTAPGSMAMFMASQSAAIKDAEELRLKLKAFDGALPVLTLDPRAIRGSRWANRHEDAFSDADFQALKDDIASAGSNVQPVCVRRLALGAPGVLNGSTPEPGAEVGYELVYGHRRHRACLELGLRVQAIVADLDDRQLFEAMERENRARKNLSAWEQGTMYRRALDEGLYPSQRKLAESLGVDISLVSKSLALARLPDAVVRAFPSPLDIQFRWAQPLAEALQKDPDGMLARAVSLKAAAQPLPAAQVLAALLSGDRAGVLNRSTPVPAERLIKGQAGRQATLSRDGQGRVLLRFGAGALSEAAERELAAFVEKLLAKR